MPALKTFLLAMQLILAGSVLAVETRDTEKRTWRVQPRESQSRSLKERPNKKQTSGTKVVTAVDSEEPEGSEPRVHVADLPPRLQSVEVESIERVVQASHAEAAHEPGIPHVDQAECCDDVACDGSGCGRSACQPLYWGRVDYLYWYLNGAYVPPLVTTSPVGTDRDDAGVLGLSTTSILVGNENFGGRGLAGGRIEFGSRFAHGGGLGWHVAYLGLQDAKDRFRFDGTITPILARPFFSVEPATFGPNADLAAFPDELEGNLSVDSLTSFEAAGLMFHWMLNKNPCRRLRLSAGYQYSGLEDRLVIADFKRVIGGSTGLAIGTTLTGIDHFRAENQFHGVALGWLSSARHRRASFDLGMQLALGNNRSRVRINGSTTASVPVLGGPDDVVTTVGGLLAQSTNIGFYEEDSFAVAPELQLGMGYDLNSHARLLLGYRFMYWSPVVRAADQIDPLVNLSQLDPDGLVGEPRPRFDPKLRDFWAQGLSVGIDCRY